MCGITAIISNKNIIYDLYESLYHLQHRGQDGFGISYLNNDKITLCKYKGLLSTIDINEKLKNISTNVSIGHVRYPTIGKNTINECQPFIKEGDYYNISIVHNGQIWITEKILNYFKINNINIDNNITSDSIYLLYFLSYHINKHKTLNYNKIQDIIKELYDLFEGSYNCICMIENYGLICFKDKYSYRPLILGKKDKSYIISSESVSITSIDYEIINDIYSNQLYIFKNNDYKILNITDKNYFKPCIFEWVYLSREESNIYSVNVYKSRLKMGEYLANKIKKKININDIDLVIPVPDTSKPIALKISEILNKPYYEALTKNRYINRTFIMNTQLERKKNIKRKLNLVKSIVENKNILIVDDSIVRGNTIKHIIDLFKNNNVNKIFVVSGSPEIINGNKYGIDIPDKKDLLLNNKSINEIKKDLNINELIFQDLDDLKKSIQYFNPKITDFELSIYNL